MHLSQMDACGLDAADCAERGDGKTVHTLLCEADALTVGDDGLAHERRGMLRVGDVQAYALHETQ